MKCPPTLRHGLLALSLGMATVPTWAGDDCDAPVNRWQSREAVRQMAASQGWQIQRLKIDDGCYECRTDVQAFQCCRDDVCTTMNACAAGQAAVFLGCDNVACNPMVRCETAPQGGPCECEIVNDGLDNDCDGYIDEPTDTNCVN